VRSFWFGYYHKSIRVLSLWMTYSIELWVMTHFWKKKDGSQIKDAMGHLKIKTFRHDG
jgi:hypothetical protein